MGRREKFVSNGLYALREKHRERIASQEDSLQCDTEEKENISTADKEENLPKKTNNKLKVVPEKGIITPEKSTSSTRRIAVKRIDEYLKNKRDLTARIHQNIAMLEDEGEKMRKNADQAAELTASLAQLLTEFDKIADAPESDEAVLNAEKELETLRIELFRTKVKVDSLIDKLRPQGGTGQISLLPELNSLNQIQMFKMGLCFALPLIIALLVGCAVIAWAVVKSMGGV
ncbi:hypothetical protein P0136_06805 [Lentisphaerota bacterium ZTH]|nr:hypothetical protein JYG24_02085 [Lentisphaerota bacterium]WET07699.1 hypothetical protein P0136_06805 [Lentisphaerota bacterium ZTH]